MASATQITEPASSTFTIPVNSHGGAEPFTVASTGWSYHQLVYIEICDGKPATAPGWNPGLDCDNETSPSPAAANSSGQVVFPANSTNFAIGDFRGASPNGQFNCVSVAEMPRDGTIGDYGSRLLSARDTEAVDGVALNPSMPAWTHCQLRVSSNNAYATADQRFVTLLMPASLARSGGGSSPGSSGSAGGTSANSSGNALSGSSGPDPSSAASQSDPISGRLANTGLDPVHLVEGSGGLIACGSLLVAGAAIRRRRSGCPPRYT